MAIKKAQRSAAKRLSSFVLGTNSTRNLLAWLNSADAESVHRFVAIHGLMIRIQEHGCSPEWTSKRERALEMELERLLGAYEFKPLVVFRSEWEIYYWSRRRDNFGFTLKFDNTQKIDEADAVRYLLRLAENGKLFALKLCAHCNKRWLLSFRAIDRFCNRKCQERHGSPEKQRRQRANQRAYRNRLRVKEDRENTVLRLQKPRGRKRRK